MKSSIPEELKSKVLSKLQHANHLFNVRYPGPVNKRQPVHTVYGGAQLFKSTTIPKLGNVALKTMQSYAPNFVTFAKALQLNGFDLLPSRHHEIHELTEQVSKDSVGFQQKQKNVWLAKTVFDKVINKLKTEPIEDFRIDFEDGFGNRPDEEEDAIAEFTARELAKGMKEGSISPYIGIRIKPFDEEMKRRGIRTLDIFLTTLAEATGGKLPRNFVVTLPKVTVPEQVLALVQLFEAIELNTSIKDNSLMMEIMIETTQSVLDSRGRNPMRKMIAAGKGRCIAAHFGTYDYTASNNIIAGHQTMDHPVCDFAHHMMKLALEGTGIWISDGATNVMPVPPHRGQDISEEEKTENMQTVHRAWKMAFDHSRHSLYNGIYQGWDLHPAQLPVRYAAVYSFFLEGYEVAAARLKNFIEQAAQSTLSGDVFDDAATGQGLLNYFVKAVNCGAITEKEATSTGLTIDEIKGRSFLRILETRLA